MNRDTVFTRTAAGEREKSNLADNLKRVLLLINGKATSGELAKRAPPSLRTNWDELIEELIRGGYIAEASEAAQANVAAAPGFASIYTPQSYAAPSFHNTSLKIVAPALTESKAEKVARLVGYFASEKEKARAEATQAALKPAETRNTPKASAAASMPSEDAHAALEEAIAAARNRSVAETQAQAEARQQKEKAARMRAQQEAAIAAAQVKAVPQTKQRAPSVAPVQVRREVATIVSVQSRAAELAKAQAEAMRRQQEDAHTRAELEAAINATKRRSESNPLLAGESILNFSGELSANDASRLRHLEIENETLKKLISEAYQELAELRNRKRH